MAFPNYKRKFWFFKVPDGWEDRGIVLAFTKGMYRRHKVCGYRVRMGREGIVSFIYCPVCLVKIK